MWKPGARSGMKFATWWSEARQYCSPVTIWKRRIRWRIASQSSIKAQSSRKGLQPRSRSKPAESGFAASRISESTMSTAVAALSNPPMGRSMSHTATIYLTEAKHEFLKNLRLRVYTASVISFPLMFYVLFGLVLNSREAIGGTRVPTYLIATYRTFRVMGASLFGTAAGLAADRGLGWLQLKRASPMPPLAYFAAKVVISMIFSCIVLALLMLLGFAFGGVRLPLANLAELLGTLVAGSLPFSA